MAVKKHSHPKWSNYWGSRHPSLAHFVRGLVGMDRSAVQTAFATFLEDRSLTPVQIRFIELVIDQLTARGVMEAGALYEALSRVRVHFCLRMRIISSVLWVFPFMSIPPWTLRNTCIFLSPARNACSVPVAWTS